MPVSPVLPSVPPGAVLPPTALRFLALLTCLLIGWMVLAKVVLKPSDIQLDSPRYAILGLNLLDHGTLNLDAYDPAVAPRPEISTGGFLTAVEVAIGAAIHADTRRTLACMAEERGHAQQRCTGSLLGMKVLYIAELLLFFAALWHLARLVLGDAARAWLTLLLVLPCRDVFLYASSVLTEPLFLCMATLFLWGWTAAWKRRDRLALWLLAGLLLGLTAHVKPVWSGLAPLLLAALAVQGFRDAAARRAWWGGGAMLALGLALMLGPMLARNVIQLNLWSLSDPIYFGQNLAHRMGYNTMTWAQWLVGWAVYLADFGDNLVKSFAGAKAVQPFSWDADGFYAYGRDVLHPQLMKEVGPEQVGRHLIMTEIFGNPVKNAAVTLLLLWRALFVGRTWALVAMVLAAPVLRRLFDTGQRELWLVAFLPALAVAAINAQASVSIVRYNLALIPGFAMLLAAFIAWLLLRLAQTSYGRAASAALLAKANRRDAR